jgi:hypothetical protein
VLTAKFVVSGTLDRMISSRTPPRRYARRRVDHRRRNRRLAGLVLVLALVAVGILHLFTSGGHSQQASAALATPAAVSEAPDGPPTLESLATAGDGLQMDVPITQKRITAIVYHGGGSDLVPLTPSGHQHNADLVTRISNMLTGENNSSGPGYYIDSSGDGPETGSVDIGAVAGTSVYSPADGRIVSVQPYVISGKTYGSVIQIQPATAPTLILTITNVKRSKAIVVGKPVTAAETRLGTVIDLSTVLTQELAKYTSDAGNHVHIEATRAPASAPIL